MCLSYKLLSHHPYSCPADCHLYPNFKFSLKDGGSELIVGDEYFVDLEECIIVRGGRSALIPRDCILKNKQFQWHKKFVELGRSYDQDGPKCSRLMQWQCGNPGQASRGVRRQRKRWYDEYKSEIGDMWTRAATGRRK